MSSVRQTMLSFIDISVEESNAADLVVHTGAATSPPDDTVCGGKAILYT